MIKIKPLVHYKRDEHNKIKKGQYAIVQPTDHPSVIVSNTRMVLTSIVKSYDKETGIFETENTIYHPVD